MKTWLPVEAVQPDPPPPGWMGTLGQPAPADGLKNRWTSSTAAYSHYLGMRILDAQNPPPRWAIEATIVHQVSSHIRELPRATRESLEQLACKLRDAWSTRYAKLVKNIRWGPTEIEVFGPDGQCDHISIPSEGGWDPEVHFTCPPGGYFRVLRISPAHVNAEWLSNLNALLCPWLENPVRIHLGMADCPAVLGHVWLEVPCAFCGWGQPLVQWNEDTRA